MNWGKTARYVLSAAFATTGGMKYAGAEKPEEQLQSLGYPKKAKWPIGAAELTGAGLLLSDETAWIGAGLLTATMIGAVASHLRAGQRKEALIPMSLLGIAAGLLWAHREHAMEHAQRAKEFADDSVQEMVLRVMDWAA